MRLNDKRGQGPLSSSARLFDVNCRPRPTISQYVRTTCNGGCVPAASRRKEASPWFVQCPGRVRVEPVPQALDRDALLEICFDLTEVQRGLASYPSNWQVHANPIKLWISGSEYVEVLTSGRNSGLFSKTLGIEATVMYRRRVGDWISWALGAAWMVIDGYVDEPDASIGILPLLVRYGVSNEVAASISLLGVSDRRIASELAQVYLENHSSTSLPKIEDWLENIDAESLANREVSPIRYEVLGRSLGKVNPSSSKIRFVEYKSSGYMEPGSMISTKISQGGFEFSGEQSQQVIIATNLAIQEMIAKGQVQAFVKDSSLDGLSGTAALIAVDA